MRVLILKTLQIFFCYLKWQIRSLYPKFYLLPDDSQISGTSKWESFTYIFTYVAIFWISQKGPSLFKYNRQWLQHVNNMWKINGF